MSAFCTDSIFVWGGGGLGQRKSNLIKRVVKVWLVTHGPTWFGTGK